MNKNQSDAICFGEILWDVLPSGAKPGGAPMNVAYHLQKLGLQIGMISRVGEDERGSDLVELLRKSNVETGFIQKDKANQTGMVHAAVKDNHEVSYEIVQPVAWDFIEWKQELAEAVSKAHFFIYGSLAARSTTSYQTLRDLIEAAKTKVVDINIRPPHYSKALLENLIGDADILKLNEHEAELIAHWYSKLDRLEDQVQFLQDKFSVPLIIVTKGSKGALVCEEGKLMRHPAYAVKIADTVGSGDAFLAGFLFKTFEGARPEERLAFANALGAFIASKEGACPAYDVREVYTLLKDAVS